MAEKGGLEPMADRERGWEEKQDTYTQEDEAQDEQDLGGGDDGGSSESDES